MEHGQRPEPSRAEPGGGGEGGTAGRWSRLPGTGVGSPTQPGAARSFLLPSFLRPSFSRRQLGASPGNRRGEPGCGRRQVTDRHRRSLLGSFSSVSPGGGGELGVQVFGG